MTGRIVDRWADAVDAAAGMHGWPTGGVEIPEPATLDPSGLADLDVLHEALEWEEGQLETASEAVVRTLDAARAAWIHGRAHAGRVIGLRRMIRATLDEESAQADQVAGLGEVER